MGGRTKENMRYVGATMLNIDVEKLERIILYLVDNMRKTHRTNAEVTIGDYEGMRISIDVTDLYSTKGRFSKPAWHASNCIQEIL